MTQTFLCFLYMVSPLYSTTLIGSSLAATEAFPSTPHLPPKGPSPSAPPPVVPHALWRCGCHQRPRARRNLQGQWSEGEKGWMEGGNRGIPTKMGYNQTKHNKKYMFGGWMWFRTELFFSNWNSLWKNMIIFYIEWNNIGLFTHFHKDKGSHIYLRWQLRTSDFGRFGCKHEWQEVKGFVE